MTTFQKIFNFVIAGIVVGLLFFVMFKGPANVGGVFNQTTNNFREGIRVGENGNTLIAADDCALIAGSAIHAASTTKPYDCAVPGVKTGDLVNAWVSTSTAPGNTFWQVVSAKASSTDGYITILLYNNGAAQNPSLNSAGSSTGYMIFRP
jgi:hypothetical protein